MNTGIIAEKRITTLSLLSCTFLHIIHKIKPGSVRRVHQRVALFTFSTGVAYNIDLERNIILLVNNPYAF